MDKERACQVLGISLDQKENAKLAYLRLSREKHPDRGGDPEEFLLIHEAYRTLVEVDKPDEFRKDKLEFHVKVSLEEAVFGVTLDTHIRPMSISSVLLPAAGKSAAHIEVVTVTQRIPPMELLKGPIVVEYPGNFFGGEDRSVAISYSLREHGRYRLCSDRSKALLSVEEAVPVLVALNGGIVEVETMFGPRKLHIKAGTNIGDSYVINNHGPLGNLEVVVSGIVMPPAAASAEDPEQERMRKEVEEEEAALRANREAADKLKAERGNP